MFHLLGVLFLVVTPLVWTMRRPQQGAKRRAGAAGAPPAGAGQETATVGAGAGH
jgi:hypothetical protein